MYLSRASIFMGLDVYDRAQAVVFGCENGRVRANVAAQTRSDPR